MYKPFVSFVLRTPLCSLNTLSKILLESSEDDIFEKLIKHFSNDLNYSALLLASPILASKISTYKKIKNENERIKVAQSIGKYFLRMITRATPFGLFSGCNIGYLTNETLINLGNHSNNTKIYNKLDIVILDDFVKTLSKNEKVKKSLTFFSNTSLYKVGGHYRYFEYYYHGTNKKFRVSEIESSYYLNLILKKTERGRSFGYLVNSLKLVGIEINNAQDFINELIENQVLTHELDVSFTGEEYFSKIISFLLKNKKDDTHLNEIYHELFEIQRILQETNPQNHISILYEIKERLLSLNKKRYDKDFVQTDLIRSPINCTIDINYFKNFDEYLDIILRISPLTVNQNIETFKESFKKRYDEQEVPLLEVLDVDYGIGYGKSFKPSSKNDLTNEFVVSKNRTNSKKIEWNDTYSYFLKKLIESKKENAYTIELRKDDISKFPKKNVFLPDTFSSLLKIIKEGNEIYYCLNSLSGSGAANLINRFGHIDEGIKSLTKKIVSFEDDREKYDGTINAELIHFPGKRVGNVLHRYISRKYEIPILANSHLPKENQILTRDLLVSVRSNKIYLRSKRLSKFVRPILTNAHNYINSSISVYRFLCDLQFQNSFNINTQLWGPLYRQYKFLPRIVYKNLIISVASWNLDLNDYKQILELPFHIDKIKSFRENFNLPRTVTLDEGDNKLYIDLESQYSVSIFIKSIKNKKNIQLTEYIENEYNSIVQDDKGESFASEFIVCFYKEAINKICPNNSNLLEENIKISKQNRQIMIGGEWVYFKIYCSNTMSDYILINILRPRIKKLINKKIIDKWFYIRYSDPDYHIRIRCHLLDIKYFYLVTQQFNAALKDKPHISNIQIDTYQRELERYSIANIEVSEDFFFHDSELIIAVLKILYDRESVDFLWKVAFYSLNVLLNDLHFDLEDKYLFMKEMQKTYGNVFAKDKQTIKQLSRKFRKYRPEILDIYNSNFKYKSLEKISVLTKKRSRYVESLKNKIGIERCRTLLVHYVHLSMNRMFATDQRITEFVFYDIVGKFYESEFARNFKSKLT